MIITCYWYRFLEMGTLLNVIVYCQEIVTFQSDELGSLAQSYIKVHNGYAFF